MRHTAAHQAEHLDFPSRGGAHPAASPHPRPTLHPQTHACTPFPAPIITSSHAQTATCVSFESLFTRSRQMVANTSVLPVPDLAWTMRSEPSLPRGMACCCTGDGCSNPQLESAATRSGESERSANVFPAPSSCSSTSSVRVRQATADLDGAGAASDAFSDCTGSAAWLPSAPASCSSTASILPSFLCTCC